MVTVTVMVTGSDEEKICRTGGGPGVRKKCSDRRGRGCNTFYVLAGGRSGNFPWGPTLSMYGFPPFHRLVHLCSGARKKFIINNNMKSGKFSKIFIKNQ